MEQYNLEISEDMVFEIADRVLDYLTEYPEDGVDCAIRHVILDRRSIFSEDQIAKISKVLTFPIVFNYAISSFRI